MDKRIFPARWGKFYPIATAASGLVALLSVWIWLRQSWVLGALLLFAGGGTFLVALAQLLCTRYTMTEGGLEARSGLSKIDVLYDDMEWASSEKSQAADGYVPMALEKNALYIYFRQGGKLYRLELSPADREGFLEELARRAPQLA